MRKKEKLLTRGLLSVIVLTALDQITKLLAQQNLAGTSGVPLIPDVFELFYLENSGAAFGMLKNRQWFFIVIAAAMFAFAVYVYICLPSARYYNLLRIICVLIAAGAVGNMIDRIFRHYVIDFLYFRLINFPVFNIADCYVCIGAAAAVISVCTIYRSEKFAFLKPDEKVEE